MHPTLRVCASGRVHTPLIHFLGKRQWPAKPEPPHAHPAAPAEYKKNFSDFLKKFNSSSPASFTSASHSSPSPSKSKKDEKETGAFEEYWQAPKRIWDPRVRNLSEEEMDAVLSGGASLV